MRQLLSPQTVKYRGTVTGLRVSAVDGGATASGGAFLDALPSAVTDSYCDGAHQIEIYDASGRMIRGVLKAVGGGEGLGSELVVNGNFSGVSITYTDGTGTFAAGDTVTAPGGGSGTFVSVGGGVLVLSGVTGTFAAAETITGTPSTATGVVASVIPTGWILRSGGTLVDGTLSCDGSSTEYITQTGYTFVMYSLNKASHDIKSRTAGTVRLNFFSSLDGVSRSAVADNNVDYYTRPLDLPATQLYVRGASSFAGTIDNISTKQVLTPSTAGCTIVSAKGGVTYNFGYKNAAFVYNQASYTVIVKKLRGRTLNVSTTGTAPRISGIDGGATESGGAFIDNLPAGVTASLRDGKHWLRVYDPAGKYIEGVMKAAGSAEGLGSNIVTNGDFSDATGWTQGAGWTVGSNVATAVTSSASLYRTVARTTNALYYYSYELVSRTAGSVSLYAGAGQVIAAKSAAATYTAYRTQITNQDTHDFAPAAFSGVVDTSTCQQVLAPSTSGCTIVNAISGTTWNWLTKEATFDCNNAGTYTFQVWSEG